MHAEVAREMIARNDWVTLYANGIRYLEKAPLLYWSMASSFRIFGANTGAARVPLALTVLLLAMTIEAFARRAFGSTRAGLTAGLITLSSFGIFIFTRITIPDAMVLPLDYAGGLLLLAQPRASCAEPAAVLGSRGVLRVKRADQGPDRHRLSHRDRAAASAADGRASGYCRGDTAALPGVERRRVSPDRHALARHGGRSEPDRRPSRRA